MILRDNTNEHNSLYHATLRRARTTSELLPFDPDYIQSLNSWVKRIEAVIKRYDGWWKHVDSNLNDDLIDTINLTTGVQKYELNSSWLKIARVRILDKDGKTWKTLHNKNRADISDAELSSTDVRYYFLLGGNLWLAGKPNYSQANGIEVQYQTNAYQFIPGDTDKEVGFDPIFEELAILGPALDYLEINGPDDQEAKVRLRIGQEPIGNIQGTGLLGALAESYSERLDEQQILEIEKSPRAQGLQIDSMGSDLNPPM